MDKTYHLLHRKRLKERFIKAPEIMGDAEILELLLGYVIKGRDVKPQSRDILTSAKKLCNIFEADIKNVKGIGPETEVFFELLREFINRVDYQKIENKPLDLSLSEAVHKFLKTKIGHLTKESFAILFLDAKNRLKGYKIIRTGFINSVPVSAREIIEHAIEHKAAGVIISHNHPTGDSTPSQSDLEMTKNICHALRHTGITLIDHMIVSYYEYYSMSAHGHIEGFYAES
jgi:DNA repair protein RadC